MEPIFLKDRSDGPQGYYVRSEDGRETGRLMFMDLSLSFLVASYPINIAISFEVFK